MLGNLAKVYGYSHWPRATFMVTHPVTTLRLAKARWDLRHADAPRIAAVAAVAIAFPLGFALGWSLRPGCAPAEDE